METAKVDIRKLQLLNDRINQCLDALSQVRLSVHGLSHTQAGSPFGAGTQTPGYFGGPSIASGFGVAPQTAGWGGPGFTGGLAHSPFVQPPMAGFPQQGFPQQGGAVGNISQLANQFPIWNAPYGLSHTGLETEPLYNRPIWSDPLLAVRLAQTFPYAQLPMPPVVAVY